MTSPGRPGVGEMVRELWDRQQISDVMLRFGRGLDLHDWEMYAATLTDRLKHTFQWCDGNPTLIDVTDPAWQEAAAAVFGTD